MKIINFILALTLFLSANMLKDYLNKRYLQICNFSNLRKYAKNEKALSIMGDACIKTDNLFMLPYIAHKLQNTSIGRKNAVYFLTIYMEKKLICSFVFDNISFEGFSLPETDYFLSYIFEALKNKKYKKIGNKIVIKNKIKNISYYIYKNKNRVYVDEFKDEKLIKRRWFR